jgi:hypothetical protein
MSSLATIISTIDSIHPLETLERLQSCRRDSAKLIEFGHAAAQKLGILILVSTLSGNPHFAALPMPGDL